MAFSANIPLPVLSTDPLLCFPLVGLTHGMKEKCRNKKTPIK